MINVTYIFFLRICRQLNLYDFLRLKKTKQPDTYYHLSFLQGRRDLLSVSSDIDSQMLLPTFNFELHV